MRGEFSIDVSREVSALSRVSINFVRLEPILLRVRVKVGRGLTDPPLRVWFVSASSLMRNWRLLTL